MQIKTVDSGKRRKASDGGKTNSRVKERRRGREGKWKKAKRG